MLYFVILVLGIGIFFVARHKRQVKKAPKISETLVVGNDVFEISGKREHFLISKNKNISFFVKDGQIISVGKGSHQGQHISYLDSERS